MKKNDILSITAELKFESKNPFCTYVTHRVVIIYSIPHFVSTKSIFSEIQISLPKSAFFTIAPSSVTQRSVSQENDLKKSKTPLFLNYRLKKFFYSNQKQFQVFKIAKFEFKVTVHCGLLSKCTQWCPLQRKMS